MEIDVTRLVRETDPFDFSASVAERGQNAGPETWANAVREGATAPLLTTEAELDALRDWAKDFGAWSAEEIAAWSPEECNALLIQYVSGDLREMEALCIGDDGEIDWDEAERLASEGTIGGSLYRGDNGRVYFYLGH